MFAQFYDELKRKGYCFPSAWKTRKDNNNNNVIRRFGSASPSRNPILETYKAVLPKNSKFKNTKKMHRYQSPPFEW